MTKSFRDAPTAGHPLKKIDMKLRGYMVSGFVSVFAAFALLSAAACEKSGHEDISISALRSSVPATAGSDFVTVQCSGEWTITLFATNGITNWASVDPASGSGNNSKVLFAYEANESTSARSVTLVLNSDGRDASFTFTQDGAEEDDGGSGSGGSSGGGSGDGSGSDDGYVRVDATSCGWLELPATYEGDGLYFYTHPMTIDGTVTRNYSFYWDKENHVSSWVAYPMNSWLIGSGSRSNRWGYYDPLVPEEEQANMANSYTGSYDRGHQIPSADRYYQEANWETFYPTNMTPQLDNFNQYIWANLESKVRNWAQSSDTLYVVTGCVMEGSTTSTTDRDGMVCPIPAAYYKAVLRYSKSSTIGYNGYMAAAVYMEHQRYSDTKIHSSYTMSIDELEEKLGIDFFVNLPDVIGETAAANVERQDPSTVSWWGWD